VRTPVLGVVGTLVWDTIHRPGSPGGPVEEWGGIAYALESLVVSLPEPWTIRPILRVGEDLSEAAYRYLRSLPRVDPELGIVVVPEPNNRVTLTCRDGEPRAERLSGGVPPWTWAELLPRLEGCGALYVNFISGFEMTLETAQALRVGYQGPIWADLHSLFLGVGRMGDRIPRVLPHWAAWLSSFDAVQMNDAEFSLLGQMHGDPWALAASAVGRDLQLVAVTLGARGAGYVAAPGFDADPLGWPKLRTRLGVTGPSVSGRIASQETVMGDDLDAIGCGDVWGSTVFARLLAGASLDDAMARGNAMAARNMVHRGARGLRHHLDRRLSPVREGA
jgi:sugar/nucleoside kinase (ribokinase family)